jgi:hypothetical protein
VCSPLEQLVLPAESEPGPFDATANATSGDQLLRHDRLTRSDTFIAQTASVALRPASRPICASTTPTTSSRRRGLYDGGRRVQHQQRRELERRRIAFTHGGTGGRSSQFGTRRRAAGRPEQLAAMVEQADLSSLAGQSVRFRFRMAPDDTGRRGDSSTTSASTVCSCRARRRTSLQPPATGSHRELRRRRRSPITATRCGQPRWPDDRHGEPPSPSPVRQRHAAPHGQRRIRRRGSDPRPRRP